MWAIWKPFLSVAFDFIVENFLMILATVLIVFLVFSYNNALNEAKEAKQALVVLQAKHDLVLAKRESEVKEQRIKRAQLIAMYERKSLVNEINANRAYGEQIAKLKLDRKLDQQKLKGLYEKDDTNNRVINFERLRHSTEASNAANGLPEAAANTEAITKSERECYTAYSILERACQITTIDYNRARAWIDSACESQGGCEVTVN